MPQQENTITNTLLRFIPAAVRFAVRNVKPYARREELAEELINIIWIEVLENDWATTSAVQAKPTCLIQKLGEWWLSEELQTDINRAISKEKKRWFKEGDKYNQEPYEGEMLTVADDYEDEPKRETNWETRKYSASFQRSKRFPAYAEQHENLVAESVPDMSKEQKDVVHYLCVDHMTKDRPTDKDYLKQAEKTGLKNPLYNRNDWVCAECNLSKGKFDKSVKRIRVQFSAEYADLYRKPLYVDDSALPSGESPHHSTLTYKDNVLPAKHNKSIAERSEAISKLEANGKRITDSASENQEDYQNNLADCELILLSNALRKFRTLEEVKGFLLFAGFSYQTKYVDEPIIKNKYKIKGRYDQSVQSFTDKPVTLKPVGIATMTVMGNAGCCGKLDVQYLFKEEGEWNWYCWVCGKKEDTTSCYMYYPPTLEGFMLSLFNRNGLDAQKVIQTANDYQMATISQ